MNLKEQSIIVNTFDNDKLKKLISESDPYVQKYIKSLISVSDRWKDLFYAIKKQIGKRSNL